MLDLAARAAFRGVGRVEPNPPVGCVIVRPGPGPAAERIIGIGHHRVFGGAHAEVEALRRCRELGHDPRNATVYVTLEPCNAHGRNPPCVTALVEAGVARVVCAAGDVSPAKGGGAAALRSAGIACDFTGASTNAADLSAPWRHRLTTPLPWVVAKWAQTIDGKLATAYGDSKWISNERSRLRVHRIRAAVDAVMVGGATVEQDNPQLTVRAVPCRRRDGSGRSCQPMRVVVASKGLVVLDRTIVQTAAETPTLIVCESVDPAGYESDMLSLGVRYLKEPGVAEPGWLRRVLTRLRAEHGVHTLLVEGGARLLGSLFRDELVNEAHVHTGTRLLGDGLGAPSIGGLDAGHGVATIEQASAWRLLSVRRVGDDVQSVYRCGSPGRDQNASES